MPRSYGFLKRQDICIRISKRKKFGVLIPKQNCVVFDTIYLKFYAELHEIIALTIPLEGKGMNHFQCFEAIFSLI